MAGFATAGELGLKEVTPNPMGGIEKLFLLQGEINGTDPLNINNAEILGKNDINAEKATLRVFHINDLHGPLVDLHRKKGDTHRFSQIVKKVREEDEFTKRLRRSSVFIPVLYEKL